MVFSPILFAPIFIINKCVSDEHDETMIYRNEEHIQIISFDTNKLLLRQTVLHAHRLFFFLLYLEGKRDW